MKSGIALLCALSLFGCAANTKAPPGGTMTVATKGSPEATFAERQRIFQQMQQWRLNGRVGLQLREQSWSFGLNWLQRASGQYEMEINNPLTGSIMATILETGSQVTLKAADGKVYKDTDAERLLERQLKLKFPLNNMRYWARGIAVPGVPVDAVKLDAKGRPTRLQQAGWVVDYPAYQGADANALPEKVQLEKASERVKAKLVAKEWQTRF